MCTGANSADETIGCGIRLTGCEDATIGVDAACENWSDAGMRLLERMQLPGSMRLQRIQGYGHCLAPLPTFSSFPTEQAGNKSTSKLPLARLELAGTAETHVRVPEAELDMQVRCPGHRTMSLREPDSPLTQLVGVGHQVPVPVALRACEDGQEAHPVRLNKQHRCRSFTTHGTGQAPVYRPEGRGGHHVLWGACP